jgi:glucokinase
MIPQQACAPTLGIDIGGSKTQGVVLDARSRIVADRVRRTEPGPDGVLATALAVATECLRLAGLTAADLGGAGVGIPGRVDHCTGVVHTAVNLGIGRLPLAERLGAALGVGVRVDNDVKATALGAADYLRRPDADLTYLNFGTGVSAATLSGGVLVRGADNLAGEIGHVPIEPGAGRCGCGQDGCIEVLAGGGRITARLAGLTPRATLADLPAAEARRIARGIAGAVQLAVLAHGSSTVAIGGGVIRTAPGLAALAGELLAERAAHSEFLASLDLPARIIVLPADHPLAAIGAALVGRPSAG